VELVWGLVLYAMGELQLHLSKRQRADGYRRSVETTRRSAHAHVRCAVIAFVWGSAGAKRALRVVGGLLVAYGVVGLARQFFPIHLREALAARAMKRLPIPCTESSRWCLFRSCWSP
jgi:hypothetical protein